MLQTLLGLCLLLSAFAMPATAQESRPTATQERIEFGRRQILAARRTGLPLLARLKRLSFAEDTLREIPAEAPLDPRGAERFTRAWDELAAAMTEEVVPGLDAAGLRPLTILEVLGPSTEATAADVAGLEALAGMGSGWAVWSWSEASGFRTRPVRDPSLNPGPERAVPSWVTDFLSLGGGSNGGLFCLVPAGDGSPALIASGVTEVLRPKLARELGLADDHLFFVPELGVALLGGLLGNARAELDDTPWAPREVPAFLASPTGSLYESIPEGSQLLHYPHDSFEGAVTILDQLLRDPVTEEIVVSLENAEKSSKFLEVLASGGAGVRRRVLLETRHHKAIAAWKPKLEAGGVEVIEAKGPRVHTKLIVARRKADAGGGGLAVLHTGNFHARQSTYLTDVVIVTTKTELVSELGAVIDAGLSGQAPPAGEHVALSPGGLRERMVAAIAAEGAGGRVVLLAEELTDPAIASALEQAAAAGASVDIVVRAVGEVAAGQGLRVHSVVGRFLEHTRVLVTSRTAFVGSADPTRENLDEVADWVLELDRSTFAREHGWFWALAHLYLADTVNRFERIEGEWTMAAPSAEGPFDLHEYLKGLTQAADVGAAIAAP